MPVSYVREEEPGLVVVGGSVKGPMDRWALGSFSESVAESSPSPALIVRDPAAFEGWNWTKGRLRVLAALDLSATSDVVLRWVKRIAEAGPKAVLKRIRRPFPVIRHPEE